MIIFKNIPYKNYLVKLIVKAIIGHFIMIFALIIFIPLMLKKLAVARKEDYTDFVYEKQ